MQAVAHNPAFAKKVGIPQKVGMEYTGKLAAPSKARKRPSKRSSP